MPNNVRNLVTISGPKEDLKAIRKLMKGDESDFDFEKILPMPKAFAGILTGGWCTINGKQVTRWREVNGKSVPVSKAELRSLMSKYGATDWYNWANDNWGTKWNCYDVYPVQERPKTLVYEFTTAWDIARGVYETLSEMFPMVNIKVKASGEIDHRFAITYQNGGSL